MKVTSTEARKLILSGTAPDGLTVMGDLDLSNTHITKLPDGLTVGGSLYLSNTQITVLPEGLTVGCWLDLSFSQITTIPRGVSVGRSAYLYNTQIKFPCRVPYMGKSVTALAEDSGYLLIAHDNGLFTAGCRGFKNANDAIRHWSREDLRAVKFKAAIEQWVAEGNVWK